MALSLDRLPGELVLAILTELPDLASLDSAIRASPLCYRIFDSYAVEIFEAVLGCGGQRLRGYTTSGYTCGHVRIVICIIAHIRSSTFSDHIPNLRNLEQCVFGEAMRARTQTSRDGFAPTSIDKNTTAAVLRSILATARRITWLTLDCIEFYLDRFRALKPHQLVDKKFRFLGRPEEAPNQRRHCVMAWPGRPASREIEDKTDLGGAYWIEEQRVMRAFWRLQLLRDLQAAAMASKLYGWPANDLKALKTGLDPLHAYDFYRYQRQVDHPMDDNSHERDPEREEMLSNMEYVVQRFYINVYPPQQQQKQQEQKNWWPPASSLRSVEVSRKWPNPRPRKDDDKRIVKRALIISALELASHRDWTAMTDYSPLVENRFEWFRPYGVALWALERLAAFGLGGLDHGFRHRSVRAMGPSYFAWFSILSPEQQSYILTKPPSLGR